MDFAFLLQSGEASPLGKATPGATAVRLLDAMDAFGCSDLERGYVALLGAPWLYSEQDRAGAFACFDRGLALRDAPPELQLELRLDRARYLVGAQRLAEAFEALEQLREPLTETPLVRALLDTDQDAAYPDDEREQVLVRDAAYWYSARADLELILGRVSAVEAPLENYERLARRSDDPAGVRDALRLRIKLALSRQLFEEVEPLARDVLEGPSSSELTPTERAQFGVMRELARHELRRRSEPLAFEAADQLRTIYQQPEIDAATRCSAARLAAGIYAEAGRLDSARLALEFERSIRAPEAETTTTDVMERANLDAIEMRVAAADPTLAPIALQRLETSTRRFLDECATLATLSSGVALLHFAQRERVLSEVVFGHLVVDGPSRGAREALRWVYESQRVGGLGRALGLSREGDRFEADLEALIEPGRGLCVFQSGRVASFLFLADASGVDVVPIAPGWRLRRDASQIANVVTRAVQQGSAVDDPSVREAVESLTADVGVQALRARLERWTSATIVGDESVGHLPLALLELSDGRRVGDVVALGYAPSIAVAAELQRRARARGRVSASEFDLRIVGVPPPPSEVRVSAGRLESWRERLGGRVELAVGDDALPAALDASGGLEAVQVIAHGKFDPTRECRAGFALAGASPETATVWSDEIERRSAARLTLLAVCRASQRPVLRGDDGRTGLAASFLLSGADCVIQTPVDLEVAAAVDFFESVSARVAEGRSPAEAVCDARGAFAARGEAAPLQDYLVHAWGAAHERIVDAPLENTASQAGGSDLARRWLTPLLSIAALLAALLLGLRLRRRTV